MAMSYTTAYRFDILKKFAQCGLLNVMIKKNFRNFYLCGTQKMREDQLYKVTKKEYGELISFGAKEIKYEKF